MKRKITLEWVEKQWPRQKKLLRDFQQTFGESATIYRVKNELERRQHIKHKKESNLSWGDVSYCFLFRVRFSGIECFCGLDDGGKRCWYSVRWTNGNHETGSLKCLSDQQIAARRKRLGIVDTTRKGADRDKA